MPSPLNAFQSVRPRGATTAPAAQPPKVTPGQALTVRRPAGPQRVLDDVPDECELAGCIEAECHAFGCRVLRRLDESTAQATPPRTWDGGKRCAECCNGDRCDDPTHYDRSRCPHCKGTGWALWTAAGADDYEKYLQGWRRLSEAEARAEVLRLKGAPSAEGTSA